MAGDRDGTSTNGEGAQRDRQRTLLAIGCIVVGALALAGSLGVWPAIDGLAAAGMAVAAGVALLWLARRWRSDWLMFAAFPVFGVAFAAAVPGSLGGAGLLAGIAAGFFALVVAEPSRWWGLIPAGTLSTLALLAWAGDAISPTVEGSVLFLGLALTFGVLWRFGRYRQGWAVFPAAGSLAMALVVGLSGADWVVPVLMIVVGAGVLVWGRRRSSAP